MSPIRTLDALKIHAAYFAAGAFAFEAGMENNYGCHLGMRSTLEFARREFAKGYAAAARISGEPSSP